jgi:hypothetical protein
MFPAIRQNGLARGLAVVLALFGLAAILLLALAPLATGTGGKHDATGPSRAPSEQR